MTFSVNYQSAIDSDQREEVELEYWFNINGMVIAFREFKDQSEHNADRLEDAPLKTEAARSVIKESKFFNLAFFQDAEDLNKRIDDM